MLNWAVLQQEGWMFFLKPKILIILLCLALLSMAWLNYLL